jgi:hypothetical protein
MRHQQTQELKARIQKKNEKKPSHEKILLTTHIAYICLSIDSYKAGPKAKSKECKHHRFFCGLY